MTDAGKLTREALPHGHTNGTERIGDHVIKRYLGKGAQKRRDVELACLKHVGDVVPVPNIVAHDRAGELTLSFVPGRHGQDLLDEGFGPFVLRLCGLLLARLESIHGVPAAIPGIGPHLVHGDFGPQNVLFDLRRQQAVAVLDWEFAHQGEAIEDVAWCEWIVRMHHPDREADLIHLFEGFGRRPPWHLRHAQMLRQCANLARFADGQGWSEAASMWRARMMATERWTE